MVFVEASKTQTSPSSPPEATREEEDPSPATATQETPGVLALCSACGEDSSNPNDLTLSAVAQPAGGTRFLRPFDNSSERAVMASTTSCFRGAIPCVFAFFVAGWF